MANSRLIIKASTPPSTYEVEKESFMEELWSDNLNTIILISEESQMLERRLKILLELCRDYFHQYVSFGGNLYVLSQLNGDIKSSIVRQQIDRSLRDYQFDIVEDPWVAQLINKADYWIV